MLSSGYDIVCVSRNSQQLQVSAQSLHKIGLKSVPPSVEKGLRGPHPSPENYWQSWLPREGRLSLQWYSYC